MTRVISNLLDNAVKFTEIDERAIVVVTEKKEEENQEVVVSKNDCK